VNDEEVKVVETPVLQLLLADRLDTLLVVERVPELGDNEELLTLDKTILDGTGNTLTSLDFVAVICELLDKVIRWSLIAEHTAGAVEEPVSRLDSIVDGVGASGIIYLPEPETNQRHLCEMLDTFHSNQELSNDLRHGHC